MRIGDGGWKDEADGGYLVMELRKVRVNPAGIPGKNMKDVNNTGGG